MTPEEVLNPTGDETCGRTHPVIKGGPCAKPRGHDTAPETGDTQRHQNVAGFWWWP